VWSGEFLRLRDPVISGIGTATFICDVAVIGFILVIVSGGMK
jgi:hypothetical protein